MPYLITQLITTQLQHWNKSRFCVKHEGQVSDTAGVSSARLFSIPAEGEGESNEYKKHIVCVSHCDVNRRMGPSESGQHLSAVAVLSLSSIKTLRLTRAAGIKQNEINKLNFRLGHLKSVTSANVDWAAVYLTHGSIGARAQS